MLKSGFETSEGKKSLGIIAAGLFFVYYILSHRYNTPPIESLLANADSAIDIAKAYAESAQSSNGNLSGDAFDTGAIITIIFGIYKTFSKYSDDRVGLKKEELKIAAAPAMVPLHKPEVYTQPEVGTQLEERK